MRIFYLLGVFLFVLLGCSTTQKTVDNSFVWSGVYKGTLPCADCGGIQTTLLLNPDKSFELTEIYQDVEGDSIFKHEGIFTWNDDGRSIVLEGSPDPAANQYRAAKGKLLKLDRNGKCINSSLSNMYVLIKKKETASIKQIDDIQWKLITFNGQKISKRDTDPKQIYIRLAEKENRFYGNGGCNSVNGTYLHSKPNHIKFSNIASTKMACANMAIEKQYFKMLKEVNNYQLKSDTLVFKVNKNIIAEFIAN